MIKGLEADQRAALVISEMQNGITNWGVVQTPLSDQVRARGLVAKINALAERFRDAGLPVVHCMITARTGLRYWQRASPKKGA